MSLLGKVYSVHFCWAVITGYIRCILLLEDLDAAFTRSVSRDSTSTGTPTQTTTTSTSKSKDTSDNGNTLSLSGLLNSLDGVAAAEGRYVLS